MVAWAIHLRVLSCSWSDRSHPDRPIRNPWSELTRSRSGWSASNPTLPKPCGISPISLARSAPSPSKLFTSATPCKRPIIHVEIQHANKKTSLIWILSPWRALSRPSAVWTFQERTYTWTDKVDRFKTVLQPNNLETWFLHKPNSLPDVSRVAAWRRPGTDPRIDTVDQALSLSLSLSFSLSLSLYLSISLCLSLSLSLSISLSVSLSLYFCYWGGVLFFWRMRPHML